MRSLRLFLLLTLLVMVPTAVLHAAVGLVTVPERDVVRMTIYNAVDLTLVQEARTLILKKGLNRIQYQWAGTLIDATSLELRCLDQAAKVEILGVVYPPNSPATLVWEIDSQIDGPAKFEISYFTSGLTWGADYVMRASPDERTAELEGWVSVTNGSGENYPKTEVRLVVGSINLVEQIRDLATNQVRERSRAVRKDEMKKAGRNMMATDAAAPAAAFAREMAAGKPEVVSARLGDYHIFSVSGVQEVTNGATTRFQAITTKEPMKLEVLYRVGFLTDQAIKLYRFINDKDHQLPDGPLPEGLWHVFRVTDAKTRALSYSGSTGSAYVPPNQKVELNLGVDPAIAIKQVQEWHGETNHHYDNNGRVDAFTTHDRYRFRLVNTAKIPVSVEYLVNANGDWTIDGLVGERRDQSTYRHQAQVAPGAVLELGPFTISTRQGERIPPVKPPEIQPLPKIQVGK
ncbi:MAG TPA: hypothetical protein VHX44_08120 [Planctomycetota bacterium]|nr:hypothetical protein [Planctomycetota bacterium]